MASKKPKQIYRLKVTLQETAPAVWRRLLVPADMSLAKFHRVLQESFGWTNSHLHCFECWSGRFGMVGIEEDADDLKDERRTKLASVLPNESARLTYRYDYGDDWEHLVVLERILEPDHTTTRCAWAAPALAHPRTVGARVATRNSAGCSCHRRTRSTTACSPGLAATSIPPGSTQTQ